MRYGIAVFALVGVTGCAAGGSGGAEPPEPSETFGGVMPAVESDPLADPAGAGVEGIQVNVPESWEAAEQDGSLCIRPPGIGGCEFGAMVILPRAAERQDGNWPAEHFNADDGWAPRPDQCRSAGTAGGGDVGVEDSQLSEGFADHADGRTSHASVWQVTCGNGDTFEVRLWYLPESDVAAYVWSVDPANGEAYDAIAASMDVSEYLG